MAGNRIGCFLTELHVSHAQRARLLARENQRHIGFNYLEVGMGKAVICGLLAVAQLYTDLFRGLVSSRVAQIALTTVQKENHFTIF